MQQQQQAIAQGPILPSQPHPGLSHYQMHPQAASTNQTRIDYTITLAERCTGCILLIVSFYVA
jgi:hypothetical protein